MRILWMYLTYFLMIAINAFANILPLNGMTTGEISNQFPVLFTPSGYVFTIWSLIYLALLIWLIAITIQHRRLTRPIASCFIATNLLNSLWIIVWHFEWVGTSILVMLLLLIMLALFYRAERRMAQGSYIWLAPLSLYIGWITVALLANISYFFHAIGKPDFLGISEVSWAILFLFFGFCLGLFIRYQKNDLLYPLVIVWAFVGIFVRDQKMSESVAVTALVLAILLFLLNWFRLRKRA
ncbi:tryptophan-rich sensory protein [Listeria costaricensis]|uniref:tryptophan-rich sensory protein n=1 Tax=Listeria costaricensis TaxID=2026604 RepID=UPI000C06F349|nr:tryptophan-rich sensory protein [Listeria costaricensis]